MASIVGGFCMSHAPGMTGWPEAPPAEIRERMETAAGRVAAYVREREPDVIVAFLDDHFENHTRNMTPAISIGVSEAHSGPTDYFLDLLRMEASVRIESDFALASHLLNALIPAGFDVARMGAIEYGNNLITPLQLIRPAFDIKIVPIFINVFTPPLISLGRAMALGKAVRAACESAPGADRIMFMGTGGLSHWPPIWGETTPDDDAFMQRMRKFQTEGRSVIDSDPDLLTDLGAYEVALSQQNSRVNINPAWDREVLAALARGDAAYFEAMTYDEVERDGGNGGHEILNWVAVMAALNDQPATVVDYADVMAWICGIGFTIYD